jgi:CheY-like chemotaxis protein
MSGIELAARIRAARPSIVVILMSADPSIIEEARRRPDLIDGALLRPFTSLELLEAVGDRTSMRRP